MFPLESREEGYFGTKMPIKSSIFNEGNGYTGKVEVIVSGRYFDPTSVNVVFERKLEVEASPVVSESESTENSEELLREEAALSDIIKPEIPEETRIKTK